jgi:hypothetical protein
MEDLELREKALALEKEQLALAEQKFNLAIKLSRELRKQNAEIARDYLRLKKEARLDVLKENVTAHGIDFLLSEITRNPSKDFSPVLATYKEAIGLVYEIETTGKVE